MRRVAVAVLVLPLLLAAATTRADTGARITRKGRHPTPGVSAFAQVYVVRERMPAEPAAAGLLPAAATAPPKATFARPSDGSSIGPYRPQPCVRRKFGGSVGSALSSCVSSRPRSSRGGSGRRSPPPDPEAVARILADRARALAPEPRVEVAPRRAGVAGLKAFFWVEQPEPIVASARVGGLVVVAQARAVQYSWSFGDGAHLVTGAAGRPWTRGRPGSLSHVYQASRVYDVSVELVWEARWRPGGGAWRRLGYFATAGSRTYPVRQVVALLVPRS